MLSCIYTRKVQPETHGRCLLPKVLPNIADAVLPQVFPKMVPAVLPQLQYYLILLLQYHLMLYHLPPPLFILRFLPPTPHSTPSLFKCHPAPTWSTTIPGSMLHTSLYCQAKIWCSMEELYDSTQSAFRYVVQTPGGSMCCHTSSIHMLCCVHRIVICLLSWFY